MSCRFGGQREEERRVSGDNSDLKALIRTIPDYPKPGIMFRDITTLIGNAEGFRTAIRQLAAPFENTRIDAVAGLEARGFIVGGAVADRLGTGFIPIRKKGKLPWKAIGQEYQLEYGVDIIEMHEDAIRTGERVLIVDDLIATGGTVEAAVKLIRRLGGVVVGAAFLIDLPEIGGAKRLESEHQVRSHILMTFEGH
jgi:adenine phosphoribosyltransferase